MKTKSSILIIIISMGLFGFSKKEKKTEPIQSTPLLGMVLLDEPNSMQFDKVIDELKSKWKLAINDVENKNEAVVFDVNGYRIAIADMPTAIPTDEVRQAAEYNYFWENGVKQVDRHKGHIIVSITNAGKNAVKENLLFSKVASSIMNNSKSIGIYLGSRSLVLEKEFYLANTEMMSDEDLPLYNWIYFGFRNENGKHSAYTYGLVDFGKKEMEIVDSENSLDLLNEMLFNLCHYVIAQDVVLKHGETIGISNEQRLKITESKGRLLDGTTLKIEF